MIEHMKKIFTGQLEAALAMLNDCVGQCPPEHWDGKIAKYTFWQVAYHTACYGDLYLSPSKEAFRLRNIHPQGWKEFEEEFPSRRIEKTEILDYIAHCREKAGPAIAAETRETLEGPSGYSWCPFSRAELHVYNIRHVQHHTGQLGVYLRRADVSLQKQDALRWVRTGWKDDSLLR